MSTRSWVLRPRCWVYRASKHLHALAEPLYYRVAGGDRRPVFFDMQATRPELQRLDEQQDVIREELRRILPDTARMPRYHQLDAKQERISAGGPAAWRTYFVQIHWAGDRLENRKTCPRTADLVDGIPDVLVAFFSILEPGKSIPAHNGPNFWYLRYHLALAVPEEKPPTLRVKDRYYTWKDGESVLFDDSWNHEVHNESDAPRVVLIVDFLRPVPWPVSWFGRLLRWMRIPPRDTWDEVLSRMRPSDLYA